MGEKDRVCCAEAVRPVARRWTPGRRRGRCRTLTRTSCADYLGALQRTQGGPLRTPRGCCRQPSSCAPGSSRGWCIRGGAAGRAPERARAAQVRGRARVLPRQQQPELHPLRAHALPVPGRSGRPVPGPAAARRMPGQPAHPAGGHPLVRLSGGPPRAPAKHAARTGRRFVLGSLNARRACRRAQPLGHG